LDIDIYNCSVPFSHTNDPLPPLLFQNGEEVIFPAEKLAQRNGPKVFSKQALLPWPKVSFLSGTLSTRCVTVLLSNGKYCSWEPGHSRQAGALAVVTVAKLLRNSDANSMEKERRGFGGQVVVFIENWSGCQEVSCD